MGLYIYVSEAQSAQIAVYRVSKENGDLDLLQRLPVGGKVMPMAISPDRRFLYAAIRNNPFTLLTLAIDPADGTLTEYGRTPAPESEVYLSVDATGRYLLGACNPSDSARKTGVVTIYPIGADGGLQLPPLQVRTPPKLHAIIPDPTNRFVVATSCNGDLVMRYAFDDATGALSSDGMSPVIVLPKSGPRHLRFHPNNRYLYLVNEYDGSVTVFRYDADKGAIYEIQTAQASPNGNPTEKNWRAADLHFTPDGRWLYVSVRSSSTIAAFSVDPLTGLLTLKSHYDTAPEPRGFRIDPSGRFLFSAGFVSKSLATFRIDPDDGSLTRLKEYETGDGPNWVEIAQLP